jgi:TonB family protein
MTVVCSLLGKALIAVVPALCVAAEATEDQTWGVLDDSCVQLDASATVLKEPDPHAFRPHPRPPHYPRKAAQEGISGKVRLQIQVDASGHVSAVRVLSAVPSGYFEQSAIKAVRPLIYVPYTIDGGAVCFTFDREVVFTIVGDAT